MPAPPPPPPTAPPGGHEGSSQSPPSAVHRLVFHGSGGSLFGIHIVNVLLTLATLGVYYFWAKTRVRVYLAGQTSFERDRFAWHGTGRELLLGFLKAILVFGVPVGGLVLLRDVLAVPLVVKGVAAALVPVVALVLAPLAMVGSRRYRLSRVSWRGIRFSFRGRVFEFLKIFILGSILTSLTLGLYYPVFETHRHRFMTEHAWFGNRRFGFDGRGRELFGSFVVMLLLVIPTFGLAFLWYLARKRRYFWDHTTVGAARFHATMTGRGLAWLYLVNLVLLGGTLGLAWPWAKARSVRYTFACLTLEGDLDLDTIVQDARGASTTGEGLAGLLDTGSGFDFS